MTVLIAAWPAFLGVGKKQSRADSNVRFDPLDPVLGWYAHDPAETPTALVIWMRRE